MRRRYSMLNLRTSNVSVGVLCVVLGLMAVLVAPRVFAQDQAADSETAAELVEDGLDALSDHAEESGRRLLARVISDFPGSVEAARAKRALAALDRGESTPEERAAIKAGIAERAAEFRRAFLLDVGDRVFFAENSAILGGRARNIIERQARWLTARPDLTVVVIGRADDGGGRSATEILSLQRAQVVRDRLIEGGIAEARIEVKAAGDADRLAVCDGPMCQAQNRNAEVFIKEWHFDGSWPKSAMSASSGKGSVSPVSVRRADPADSVSQ
ncbi:peptidoglycan-associated lipoprotein [Hyphomicrobium facile]|uniref:Peptidoglycan-associated lipoprotein n=2 Tax=Hyphomicrobium facile TaxID=51670 RepID=A0A1I7MZN6_9HYPH|nr:peptidoglycan-associated lipoprotein [Hyphomicrobium facile]